MEEKYEVKEGNNSITELRDNILKSLLKSGFSISDDGELLIPNSKEYYKKVQISAVNYILNKNTKFLNKFDDYFLQEFIKDGKELDVQNIKPTLVRVSSIKSGNLFRWTKMHWSVPISAGYGRRLRYIVYDKGNDSLIGIIGLADPVFALGDRDKYIGWTTDTRKKRLKHVMDAFVLGAVPPYSQILGGKLVASLLMSPRVRNDFSRQYRGKRSLISGEVFDGKLAAITTASALGKSSIYDRIKIENDSEFLHVGWSKGSGEFQFINGLYDQLFNLASSSVKWAKNPLWGKGSRNRRVIVQEGLSILGLPRSLLYHNIPRELFLIPLGSKALPFLREETKQISYYKATQNDISKFALKRWVIPRSERRKEYLDFKKEQYSLINNLNSC
jgi:hypothetical protein